MVFVLNREGKPLMPASCRTARKLLESKRAHVEHRTPFTVRLLHGASGSPLASWTAQSYQRNC